MGDELCCIAELLCCCIFLDDYERDNYTNNTNNINKQYISNSNTNDVITIVEGVPLLKNRRSNNIERE